MKVTQLMEELKKFLEEHGDLEVWVYDNNCGGHYNCEPYSRLDVNDGVCVYLSEDKVTRVARIETQC